jgi:DNA-binding LacI/PurR family transcriptional regulator
MIVPVRAPAPGAAAGPRAGGDVGKVTLQDIADVVGVSRMTVSNAFNRPDKLSEALRTRILETAGELGYGGPDPSARALARGRSGTVGLLLTDTLAEAFRDPVSAAFLVAVGDALAGQSLALTLVSTAGDGSPDSREVPMDGAIVYVCDPLRVDLEELRRRGVPVVTVDQAPAPGVPAVTVDDVSGARAAAQHVVDLGHRQVGLLTLAPVGELDSLTAVDRGAGWREPLAAVGIEPVEVRAEFRPATAAYDAARSLLERPDRPTALLCFSDVFAAQAVRAAADLGLRVPEDLSVVGYDDADFAETFRPALTTVRQEVDAKGRAAVAALTALIDGREPERMRTELGTRLVVRESTGPAPPSPLE